MGSQMDMGKTHNNDSRRWCSSSMVRRPAGRGRCNSDHGAPRSAMTFKAKDINVLPISPMVAKAMCESRHYLGSYPGGALHNYGVFVGGKLLGVVVLGVGPANVRRLFRDARQEEVVCLARFWLDDRLGSNAESRAIGVILRGLRRWQSTVKALVAYSDPAVGHSGVIYRAVGFLYLGESEATSLYRLPDGSVHHSRSLSHVFGTHSRRHFRDHGVIVDLVPQTRKLIYVALINPGWRERLTRSVLPYVKSKEEAPYGD